MAAENKKNQDESPIVITANTGVVIPTGVLISGILAVTGWWVFNVYSPWAKNIETRIVIIETTLGISRDER